MKAKKIKKVVLTIIALIVAAALLFGGYIMYRFNCNKSDSDFSYDSVFSDHQISLNVNDNGEFRILKINDTHFFNGVCDDDVKTLNGIQSVLETTTSDLIIVDGDLVEGFNLKSDYDKYQAIDIFADLIEKYNTPWTFAPGNNDGEIDGSNEDVIAHLMQYDNFIYGNSKSISGDMQFFIDLNYQNELVHSVAVMDSGARKPKAIGGYDYIKQSQIDWLLDGINSRNVKTSVFFHMPTVDFQSAYDGGEVYDGFAMYNTYPYDGIEENRLFAESISGNENITLLSAAHQHSNNMCSFYDGRYYQLSSCSGYGAGHHDFITPCCTLTTIDVNDDNTQTMYSFEELTY